MIIYFIVGKQSRQVQRVLGDVRTDADVRFSQLYIQCNLGLRYDPDDPKSKQPYFIRLKSQKPMSFGALAQVHPGLDPYDGDGFVIITAANDQGMVNIHDRKQLC